MLHLVTAIVKSHRLVAVKDALTGAGVTGMTVGEAKGFGLSTRRCGSAPAN